jgi:hypothetical protein
MTGEEERPVPAWQAFIDRGRVRRRVAAERGERS